MVILDAGRTFLSGNLVLKSNVTLFFEENAKLKQSPDPNDYIEPRNGEYVPTKPLYGHDVEGGDRKWNHAWSVNFPFVYAGEGTVNVKITGRGIIEMTRGKSCDDTLHMCPIGMYETDGFEISEITVQNYNSYAIQPSQNIEIDHNVCRLTNLNCKTFAFIPFGASAPDLREVEISNIYVHDNDFQTIGIWPDDPYDNITASVPIKQVRFENNTYTEIQDNFYAAPISDISGLDCMTSMQNGNFEHTGEVFWSLKKCRSRFGRSGWARIDNASLKAEIDPDLTTSGTTLFADQPTTYERDGEGYRNELGFLFSAKVDGTVPAVRIYTTKNEQGTHYVSFWDDTTGELVSEEIYAWEILPGYEGWREFKLPAAVKIEAGRKYVVTVSAGPDCLYMWGENQLASPVENEYLRTYTKSGRYSNDAKLGKIPRGEAASNYFRDIVFVPDP